MYIHVIPTSEEVAEDCLPKDSDRELILLMDTLVDILDARGEPQHKIELANLLAARSDSQSDPQYPDWNKAVQSAIESGEI